MSTTKTVKTQIEKLINSANETTGNGDRTLTDGVDTLIGGYAQGTGATYEGEYEITPKVEAQTLNTKGKFLEQDVTVKEIPYYDAQNDAGGTTVYIAKEM